MAGETLFHPESAESLAGASKAALIDLIQRQAEEGQKLLKAAEASVILAAQIERKTKEFENLKASYEELKQKFLILEGHHILLKSKVFGKAKDKPPTRVAARDRNKKKRDLKKPRRKLPSERYPDAPLVEHHVELESEPPCSCCGTLMDDSGMTEDSEYLNVVPAQFYIVRVKRHKYRCGKCHGDIKTAPALPRIQPKSVLGDDLIIDVALSKYCDLIPIERYSSIAGRQGLEDLSPPILHEATHNVTDFISGAYLLTKEDALSSRYLNADETHHKMLEGDDKKNWRLWGFMSKKAVYFEIRDTRSGDVASELLVNSQCEYLMSDVYSGYSKAVSATNKEREKRGAPPLKSVFCNAHVVRKFKESKAVSTQQGIADPECEWILARYGEIYDLDAEAKDLPPDKVMELREKMIPIFEEMKLKANQLENAYSSKSSFSKALQYFTNHYDGFILFTTDPELEIDNNAMERRLRNPVVGRKIWLGTHSKRGALTAAILFTLVESCKLLEVNPRAYFKDLIRDLHQGAPPYSPYQYKSRSSL